MARRKKKKSKKNERIPVIDFLLDIAQIATLNYIAYKRREKRGGKRGNKIDPYEATGMLGGSTVWMAQPTEYLLMIMKHGMRIMLP